MRRGNRQQAAAVGVILLIAAVILFVYWGNRKQIWFCDEVYSYESANGFEQDWPHSRAGEWMTGADVEAFFAADSDELSLGAITVRLYNDHVPLYFWLFRTVSFLFFPGSGTVWIGLLINLFFYLLVLGAVYWLFVRLTDSPVLSGAAVFLICVASRLMIEQITLLRMYVMLLWAEIFLLLAGLWILRELDRRRVSPGAFIFLFLVSVTGFLTHYDFWVFYAVTAAVFCLWLLFSAIKREGKRFWASKEFWCVLAWAGVFIAALLSTIFIFPYCRWNLNRGKGQMALKSIFDFSAEKLGQIAWGYRRLAASCFGGELPPVIGLAVIFGCILGGMAVLRKNGELKKLRGLVLTVLTALGYQTAVCFTFPSGEEERYLWGSFTILLLCMAWGGILLIRTLGGAARGGVFAVCFVCFLAGQIRAIDGGNGVAYLFYPGKDTDVLREYGDIPWVAYGSAGNAYSYYDWIIPEEICFLTGEDTPEDAAAIGRLRDEERFVAYIREEDYSSAAEFMEQELGQKPEGQYLMQSTNFSVYLMSFKE